MRDSSAVEFFLLSLPSIITRYLSKQVLSTALVVVTILIVVIMGGQLVRYFGIAAQGRMDVGILFELIATRLPEFLTLIIPLGFFFGLMLVFGRLYAENEMAVFNASGVSRVQLGKQLLPLTAAFLIFQMVMMMFISPWGNRQYDQLTTTQAIRSGFDLIRPKEFVSSGRYSIYAENLSSDRRSLTGIFFYQKAKSAGQEDILIMAKEARRVPTTDGSSVVDLKQGRRYSFVPGQAKYSQAEFEAYRLRLEPQQDAKVAPQRVEAMTMQQLWQKRSNPIMAAEWGWRIFGGWCIFLALVLALPLSEVSPRQGRYHRLFPALLIFASLIVALMAVKTRITKAKIGIIGYPLVLGSYGILAWWLSQRPRLTARLKHHNATT